MTTQQRLEHILAIIKNGGNAFYRGQRIAQISSTEVLPLKQVRVKLEGQKSHQLVQLYEIASLTQSSQMYQKRLIDREGEGDVICWKGDTVKSVFWATLSGDVVVVEMPNGTRHAATLNELGAVECKQNPRFTIRGFWHAIEATRQLHDGFSTQAALSQLAENIRCRIFDVNIRKSGNDGTYWVNIKLTTDETDEYWAQVGVTTYGDALQVLKAFDKYLNAF